VFAYMGFGRESVRLSRAYGQGMNPSKLTALTISPICGSMVTNVGIDIVKV